MENASKQCRRQWGRGGGGGGGTEARSLYFVFFDLKPLRKMAICTLGRVWEPNYFQASFLQEHKTILRNTIVYGDIKLAFTCISNLVLQW